MQVGVGYDMRNPPQWFKPFPDFYAETLEHVVLMEKLGFDAVVFSEHHFDGDGYLPSLISMMAAAAAKTSRVSVGSALFVLPWYHPVRLAEDVAVLDILSRGRVLFQAGVGYRPKEFAAFGIERKYRGRMTEESMEIIRKCWTEETFSYEGRHWRLQNVGVWPKPVQKPHPPMFLVADHGPTMDRVARMGFGATTHATTGWLDPGDWKRWHRAWQDKLREHGRDPKDYQCTSLLPLFAVEDPEKAWHKHRWGTHHVVTTYALEGGGPIRYHLPEDRPGWDKIYQTPEDCVKYIHEVYGGAAPDQLHLWAARPSMTFEERVESFRLFAEKVLPKIRDLR